MNFFIIVGCPNWNEMYMLPISDVGPEFEDRIRLNEAGNTKFNFLNRHDPYHSYYQHKINEIKEGVAQEQLAAQQPGYIVSSE